MAQAVNAEGGTLQPTYLESVPEDSMEVIVSYLTPAALLELRLVSRNVNRLVESRCSFAQILRIPRELAVRGEAEGVRTVTLYSQFCETVTYATIEAEALEDPSQEHTILNVCALARRLYIGRDEERARNSDLVQALDQIKETGGHTLSSASDPIRDNPEMVLVAMVESKPDNPSHLAFDGASDRLKGNRNFLFTALSINPLVLNNALGELKRDREYVLRVVSLHGRALFGACEALQDDEEVVMTAISQDGTAYGAASERLQRENSVLHTALLQDGWAWFLLDNERKMDDRIFTLVTTAHPDLRDAIQNCRSFLHAQAMQPPVGYQPLSAMVSDD
ncbi:MAG: hypothetical protein S4CHLAM102_14980 [Chlamydiia bacterium]|nr:hypothetical protein [Chlamydiia bacterium]